MSERFVFPNLFLSCTQSCPTLCDPRYCSLLGSLGLHMGFHSGSAVKNPSAMQETQKMRVQSLGREGPPEECMATHSIILAWRIPWTEELGWLQSIGSQRFGHD